MLNMYCSLRGVSPGRKVQAAFTLAEVVIALAIFAIVIQGVIWGYVTCTRRAEWSAHSLAAQSLASQGVEQARAAKWDPQSWPMVDELPPSKFEQIDALDIPIAGTPRYATNFITITQVSANPPLREIRADCVWKFLNRGLFTNTVITLRAPDQ
jgi:prepilin-type N-terminal cleavage/methylation domain-containing protein